MTDQQTIVTNASQELSKLGGILRCQSCHRTEPLGDIGSNLSNGWPTCCGHTMHWWTQRQIDAGEGPQR